MEDRGMTREIASGWFQIAGSEEVAAGGVVALRALGRELVLFRTAEGRAAVLDAHCPHLGAHLGHGGVVDGEVLRCPFHGWCFRGDGRCERVPYARKVPAGAVARAWPVREVNGGIFVFHGQEGQGDDEPWAGPPEVQELADPGWQVVERARWRYECHLLEMVDNAADPMHLLHLHGGLPPAVSELREAGAEVWLTTKFLTDPERLGFAGEAVPARIDARLCGPGVQVIRFSALVEGLVYLCFTPVERSTDIDARMVVAVKKMDDEGMTAMVGEMVRKTVVQQFEEDVRIWKHKAFLLRPVLAEGDGPVGRIRRWARQFYEGGKEAQAPLEITRQAG